MTALPLRPALADVLWVLTSPSDRRARPWLHGETRIWLERDGVHVHWTVPATPGTTPGPALWGISDAREGLERLQSRGIAPDDDPLRFFRCSCDGVRPKQPARGGQMIRHCGICEDFADERPQHTVAHPPTIPALVAWASLGPAMIRWAEDLARYGAHLMTLRSLVVVWHVAPITPMPSGVMLWQYERQRAICGPSVLAPCDALLEMGVMWVRADDHAITLVVPPIGGDRG